MKRLMKQILRAIWRLTAPVRRPIVRKIEAMLRRCCVQPPAHPAQVHLVCKVSEEAGLLMDHMVRELVRLQSQVERLQHAVEDLTPASTTCLLVVSDHDGDEMLSRSAAG